MLAARQFGSNIVKGTVLGTAFVVGTVIGQDVVIVVTSYLRPMKEEKQTNK